MTRALNMPTTVRGAVKTVRSNPVLMVPTLVSIALAIGVSLFIPHATPETGNIKGLFLRLVVAVILNIYAHGVTAAMALEARKTGSTSLATGRLVATRTVTRLLPLALLIGLSFSIGFMLFVLPGLIAALMFMYAMPAMVVGNLSPFDALAESIRVVKRSLRQSLGVMGMIGITSLGLGLLSLPLIFIPMLGLLLNAALSSAFTAVVTVIILEAYLKFSSDTAPPADPVAPIGPEQ